MGEVWNISARKSGDRHCVITIKAIPCGNSSCSEGRNAGPRRIPVNTSTNGKMRRMYLSVSSSFDEQEQMHVTNYELSLSVPVLNVL